jgi:hypothetical protein
VKMMHRHSERSEESPSRLTKTPLDCRGEILRRAGRVASVRSSE